jgi:hypothetical protein
VANKAAFPKLGDWKATRDTLHAYCKVLGAIRAAFTPEQPRYAHVSLRLYTSGLTTTPMPHPTNPARWFSLSLDLRNHYVLVSTSEGEVHQIRMSEGFTGTELGEQLLKQLQELGVTGSVNKQKYANTDSREYALADAEAYFQALSHIGRAFETFRGELSGEVDPVQFWPHHFDLAFVILGKKQVKTVEGEFPSQITVGFAPDEASQPTPYFYMNPYPFEESLTHTKLPDGAVWHTALWQGALLPYSEISGKPDAEQRILDFLRTTYQVESKVI